MRIHQSRSIRIAAAAIGIAALAGCSTGADVDPTASPDASGSSGPELTGELSVSAAASLTAAFDELSARFEAEHPDVDVLPISYDGSSTLATQLVEGAPADVFASADEANMDRVVDEGLAADPQPFATNTLVLVVPEGNPGGVTGLADLADEDLAVVLCAPEVPCGAASERLLEAAGVEASVDSAEQSVTAVLTKVETGEADAGLVYVTDATSSDAVETVEAEGADEVVNTYPIVALDDAPNPEAAQAFVDFVRGDEGRAVLEELGFGAP